MSKAKVLKEHLESSGKFKVLEEILEGANAYSFRALHTPLADERFLKIYDYVEAASMELLREPRVLAEMQKPPGSPNVVQLFDAEVIEVNSEKYLMLQMEFVQGSSLLKLLQTNGIGQQSAIRVTASVLAGVIHLHSRRIVHRDLKPANILAANTVPKLTDFGSVALIPEGTYAVSASKHSAIYVPPESSGPDPQYSFLSDIYQVGMVLYELINGPLIYDLKHYVTKAVHKSLGKPFDELDDYEKTVAADSGISELATKGTLLKHGRIPQPYLSKKVSGVINKATNPNCDNRYQDAQAFLAAINKLDLPNWKPAGPSLYLAEEWRGWDWVFNTKEVWLKKSQVGKGNYRKLPGQHFSSSASAFSFVESYGG